MISKIYLTPVKFDIRGKNYQNSFNRLELSGKVTNVSISDAYTIDGELTVENKLRVSEAFTNKIIESSSIDKLPDFLNFDFICEIGYLPGVTDNAGTTTKEVIEDMLGSVDHKVNTVYTSKLFFITGNLSDSDLEKIAYSLHNPLIERFTFIKKGDLSENGILPIIVPEVKLVKQESIINVPLNVSDEELRKIGKEGILGPDGQRRGPLALDLLSMQTIKKFYKEKLKRDPTDIELESLAQTWSEHCKHTIFANSIDDVKDGLYKTYIKGATNIIRKNKGKKDFCVSVFSDNAGGIIFDKNFVITHKVETHNSPSALDPFGGAITGIVGVNRDTIGFGLGAKPIANMYGFCFGNPNDQRLLFRDKNLTQKMLSPKRIMDGVIKGVNVGGNCSGIPTVSGFIRYDNRFRAKPLVFVGTVGLIPRKINGKLSHIKAAKAGDYIVVVGGRVGADGIHGATFSSVVMNSSSPATAVQIGDPITQKKLSDAIVKEARDLNLYNSITDNGAGGISCSVAEMAKECGGAIVDIEKVPLKYPGLTPWQIWISESQERMTLSVPKNKWGQFKDLMESRGVEATCIGEFTNDKNCTVRENGKIIMNIPMDFLHNGMPSRQLESLKANKNTYEPILPKRRERTKELISLLSVPNISGFKWVSSQYDHEVQASSVLKPLSGHGQINTDAQVIQPVLGNKKGVILSTGLYPSYSDIDTYNMSACAIDTAIRNAITSGASLNNLAILDNFCWCSSYDKNRLAELHDSLKACYDYAVGYGTPFISGKDSMFNDFKGYDEKGNPVLISIPPTLLISAVGVVLNINKVVSLEFKFADDLIYMLGDTNDELGGSEYFKMLTNNDVSTIGKNIPKVNLKKNIQTYKIMEKIIQKGIIASSISVGLGGLVCALAKASVGGSLGVNVFLDKLSGTATTIDAKLFGESQGRIVVTVSKKSEKEFLKTVKKISYTYLGKVKKNSSFIIKNNKTKIIDTTVDKLLKSYHYFSNNMKS